MKIVHMHAEHFEPFDNDQEGCRISTKHVETWIKAVSKSNFVPSAFFSSQGIPLQNRAVIEEEAEIVALLQSAGIDIHVHIHHPIDGMGDTNLLRRVLQETLDRNFVSDRNSWAFVHGCWALQGSDRTQCQIDSELSILYQYGCRADMTFPPGRQWCRPDSILVPYYAIPAAGPKAYDTHAADPIPVLGDRPWSMPGRMLIWNTTVPMDRMSFDILSTVHGTALSSICELWIDSCPRISDTIYIKTHSHPLNPIYWPSRSVTTGPVANAEINALFDKLRELCPDTTSISVSEALR